VTDGADPRPLAALPAAALTRVIGVGQARDNQAVTALALRPSLRLPDPDSARPDGEWLAMVSVFNAGPVPRERTLTLARAGEPLAVWTLTLAPGETQTRTLGIGQAGAGLSTTLLPARADALPLDDALALARGAAPAPFPTQVQTACPPQVRAALRAHPGLDLGETRPAKVRVRCAAGRPSAGSAPTLWLRPGPGAIPVEGVPVWAPELAAGLTPVPAGAWSRVAADPADMAAEETGAARTLLAAEGIPLIVETQAGGVLVVDVRLATTDPAAAGRPELPVLLAALLDRLAGAELLAPVTGAYRDPLAARIAPGPLPRPGAMALPASVPRGAAPWLLAAALAILLWDLLRLGGGRRWSPAQPPAGRAGGSPA
jgi:hypothetical protein